MINGGTNMIDDGKEKYGFTIEELFEQAANDDSWESDPIKRKLYTNKLKATLTQLT